MKVKIIMPEEPFKNREILEMFTDVKSDLTDIKAQTTKHNGRMSTLEKWMYMTMGALTILSMFVVPMLGWALTTLVNIDSRIQSSVDQALSAYDINK